MPGITSLLVRSLGLQRRGRVIAGQHPESADGWWGTLGTEDAGQAVDEWRALNLSTFWCCVMSIAEDLAKLPLPIFRRIDPSGRERARSLPAYTLLLRRPNPEMTAIDFRSTMSQYLLRYGNAYAEVERDNRGNPINLWIQKPWRVDVARDRSGEIVYQVTSDTGTRSQVPASDMLHIRGLGNGIVGYSPVRWAMRSLGIASANEAYAARVWEHNAIPPAVLKHPGKLTPAATQMVRESWERIYGGDNQGRIAVLPEGMQFEALSVPNNEAQFLESRKFSVGEICRWFRFPPHMAGDLDRATFSNIEHQSISYVTGCLLSWMVRWEQQAGRVLLGEELQDEYYFEHVADALLRGDANSRADAISKALNAGYLTVDEARDMENRPAVDGGDVPRAPVNTQPLDVWRQGNSASAAAPSPDPSGDQASSARSIVEAFLPAMVDRISRVLHLEADKARRAAKRGELQAWSAAFYATHADHVRGEMIAVLELVAATMRAATPTYSIDVPAMARSLADMHVGRSIVELMSPSLEAVLAAWEQSRAADQAAACIATLAGSIARRPDGTPA